MTPLNNQIGKVLVEIGKALGKAVVAGIGLELARAASGHVKRVVGPKDAETETTTTTTTTTTAKKKPPQQTAAADDVDEVRKENQRLREELAALKAQQATVVSDD